MASPLRPQLGHRNYKLIRCRTDRPTATLCHACRELGVMHRLLAQKRGPVLALGWEKTSPDLLPGRASAPQRPPNKSAKAFLKSAMRPPRTSHWLRGHPSGCPKGGLGRLIGRSRRADAPPGIKSGFVISQPLATTDAQARKDIPVVWSHTSGVPCQ